MASKDSGIYVKKNVYTTGGVSKSASSLSLSDIGNIEAKVLKIPKFPDVTLNITKEEVNYMVFMLNHVTIQVADWPHKYLHIQTALPLASELSGKPQSDISVDESIDIINRKCTSWNSIKCPCLVHKNMPAIEEKDFDFAVMLEQLQRFDVSKPLMDQTGAQVITEIVELLIKRQKLKMRCYSKGASLQVSCTTYDVDKGTVDLLNATPDFIVSNKDTALAVGEIESSPYVQMVVAGLGHIANKYVRYLIGVCVSKQRTVDLYLIENDLTPKIVTGQMFVGAITVKPLSLETYNFLCPEKFNNFLKKFASALSYLLDDYEERVNLFEMEMSQIPPDDGKPRRTSERNKTPELQQAAKRKKY